MKNLIESTLNLFFPPVCGMCDNLCNGYLCNHCYEYVKTQEKNRIDRFEDKHFSEHFWMYEYKNEIRKKIIDYKFNDKSYLYRTFLEMILKNELAVNYIKSFDLIIPVPIHKKRYQKRGYNQSALIARAVGKNIENIEYQCDILRKIINVRAQSSLNKSERLKNIMGAYKLDCRKLENVNELKNKRILLFDDVYTTGSTVNECAKVLKEITDKKIGVFTIAKD